jgi:hypothetical protein
MSTDSKQVKAITIMNVVSAFGILFALVVAMAGYIVIATRLGLDVMYGAFVFLWYWAICQNFNFKDVPSTLAGALVGVAVSGLMQFGTVSGSLVATAAAMAFIACSIILSILQRGTFIVNPSYFLFLTVTTIPLIQQQENLTKVAASVVLGIIYFGLIVWVLGKVADARRVKSDGL